MLSRMTPDQFRRRYAHYLVEPWGDEWRQTAMIVETVANQMSRYFAFKLKTANVQNLVKAEDVIPRLRFPSEPQKVERQTPQQMYDLITSQLK